MQFQRIVRATVNSTRYAGKPASADIVNSQVGRDTHGR